jgi:cation diffusion facilitator family transporter
MGDHSLDVRQERVSQAKKPLVFGIFANLLLAGIKLAAGIVGHSYALVADGAESGADVLTSTAVLFGLSYSSKPADEDHPHGHGKAEPLAAAFVSFALFGAAAWIATESIHLIGTPHRLPAAFTLGVLLGVLVIKEALFRYAYKVGEQVGSTAVKADAVHQRSDVFVSAAAFIGISVALIGGKGWESADDWAALVASAFIIYGGCKLLASSISELLDKAPPEELRTKLRSLAMQVPDVLGTHKCLLRKVGLDLLVEMDVLVEGTTTVTHAHAIAHAVQDHLRAEMPEVARVLVHIEPMEGGG